MSNNYTNKMTLIEPVKPIPILFDIQDVSGFPQTILLKKGLEL